MKWDYKKKKKVMAVINRKDELQFLCLLLLKTVKQTSGAHEKWFGI
jgi:hypothetical protein